LLRIWEELVILVSRLVMVGAVLGTAWVLMLPLTSLGQGGREGGAPALPAPHRSLDLITQGRDTHAG